MTEFRAVLLSLTEKLSSVEETSDNLVLICAVELSTSCLKQTGGPRLVAPVFSWGWDGGWGQRFFSSLTRSLCHHLTHSFMEKSWKSIRIIKVHHTPANFPLKRIAWICTMSCSCCIWDFKKPCKHDRCVILCRWCGTVMNWVGSGTGRVGEMDGHRILCSTQKRWTSSWTIWGKYLIETLLTEYYLVCEFIY